MSTKMASGNYLQFIHPFTCVIAGPSQAGKSVFVKNLLRNLDQMVNVKFGKIIYCYGEWQPGFQEPLGVNIEYQEGLPNKSDYSQDVHISKLLILDDLMLEAGNSVISDMFVRGSHHNNLSVIFITQNLFYQGKGLREINLNSSYLILFKNPRDKQQIMFLARQVYPQDTRFLQEAYLDATSNAHGYLVIDLKQQTSDDYRFKTCIFPFDQEHYFYVPRKRL